MEKAELIERLKGYEWNDIEFKEARRDVPRSAYETVSAFANTEGGHLVFGVRQSGDDFEVVGVLAVDKVQGDFLTTLRQPNKISVVLDVKEALHRHGDADLLVFHVPEASRAEKPVYLDGNIDRSFVRRGGSDIRCSVNERDRFLVDAMPERFDGRVIERNPETTFDSHSVKWYREIYERRPGNRSHADLSDLEFLEEMGLLVERDGRRTPTRAAVLLFGCNAAFRQLLPRPVVDCQRFALSRDQADTGARWLDRTVLDENLIRTWRSLVGWYERFAERPFRIDPATLQRDDTPPDYLAYRESLVNLLIHQDYSDQGRKAEVRHYTDQTVFWNPGDAFDAAADLLEPGEKEVRNPRIVTAFRRIGLSENAGWGLRDVFRNWQQLGNVPPRITNNKRRKCFELVLLREELLSERQRLFQAQLGVHLTDEQARAFAFICRDGKATLPQLKAVTGLPATETMTVTDHLVTQGLVERSDGGEGHVLAQHLGRRLSGSGQVRSDPSGLITDQAVREPGALVTDQAARPSGSLVSDQAGPKPGRLVTDQARSRHEDLSAAQPFESSGSLSTAQAGSPPTDSSTAQAARPSGGLVSDQVGPKPGRLVTDQARPGQEDLSTAQVDRPSGSLSTTQATRPPGSLFTAQGERPTGSLSTVQAESLTKLSANQRKIIEICDVPHSLGAIMRALGVTGRGYFKQRHLDPLLRGGVLRMTHPDQPKHPDQAYVLTEAGARLKAGDGSKDVAKADGSRTNGA